jgi:hypothetical protein
MKKNRVLAAAFSLALGIPVVAFPGPAVSAERAAQRIESAQAGIESAMARHGMVEVVVGQRGGGLPSHVINLERAQGELAAARERYERGDFREAERLAYRAARLAWKASDPRKGDKQ